MYKIIKQLILFKDNFILLIINYYLYYSYSYIKIIFLFDFFFIKKFKLKKKCFQEKDHFVHNCFYIKIQFVFIQIFQTGISGVKSNYC